jgi:hypothetical protein
MPLEIGCPGCGRRLRIGEDHAGKQIRCPACNHISQAPEMAGAPSDGNASSTTATAPDATTWHVRSPDGPIYGPIAWNEVQLWADEGRIAADCQLAQSAAGPWREASELLPGLKAMAVPLAGASSITTYPWTPGVGSSAAYTTAAAAPRADSPTGGYVAPHRGGLILFLGLLGFTMGCPVLSLLAWVMGSHDLREMRVGCMDRGGEGLTQAGTILGMILSLIWLLFMGGTLVIILIVAAAQL